MEFHEKLQELRKSRSLTQEELAEALFVSRTAVSKWESGRGYPSIASLEEISRFFGLTIDELIRSDEILSVAEKEKREVAGKYISLVCCILDILSGLLFFLPVFGKGSAFSESVDLFHLDSINPAVKTVWIVLIGIAVANGLCGAVIVHFDRPRWNRHRVVTGIVLSILAVMAFIVSRQPYAGALCFSFLVIKGFLLIKGEGLR